MKTMTRVLSSLLLIASVGALASASSLQGQTTGPKIAFEKTVGRKNAEIWVMNADGSQPQQVTAAHGLNVFPAVSPS
jgi:Tol biopolymer transport system component